ncbi:MAG: hypothetical protein ACE5JA_07815, partial [bacterium]
LNRQNIMHREKQVKFFFSFLEFHPKARESVDVDGKESELRHIGRYVTGGEGVLSARGCGC